MTRESGNTQSFSKIVVLLAFTVLLPCAQAAVLTNGTSTTPSAMTPGGTVFQTASGVITAGVGTVNLSVNYSQTVFQDQQNSWCAGCLDFVYVFTNNGPDPNERYSMSSFQGFSLDVGTNPFNVLTNPTTIDRSILGSVVGFNFPAGNEISAGTTTVQLVIETDAKTVVPGSVSAQNGVAGSGFAWAPAPAAIPEPGSLVLVGSGLVAVGGFLRKSRFGKIRS